VAHVSRGFRGKRAKEHEDSRLPPGQYVVEDFPVLSAGPTPSISLDDWTFSIEDEAGELRRWGWAAFNALPSEEVRADIHCVTKWSKLSTLWEGVSIDALLDGVEHNATHVLAFSYGGYSTNLPLQDVVDGKAWVAFAYAGKPLEPEHGGPARLLVPHLYFWKSRLCSAAKRRRASSFGRRNKSAAV
jgi:DMSO/TMAO reductase YedYZ molybdopterin-dependent catalytic subunit